jgi:hypothetical protein
MDKKKNLDNKRFIELLNTNKQNGVSYLPQSNRQSGLDENLCKECDNAR